MYGFIYITTNQVNGKRYLGMCAYHKPNQLSYLGSGKALKRAVKKYGRENFSREIIFIGETKECLSAKEIEFITEYKCAESLDWYNIAGGGYATRGFAGKKHTDETRAKMRANHKRILTEQGKKNIGEACKKRIHKLIKPVSVIIDGITYPTLKKAMESTNMTIHTVRKIAGLIKVKGNDVVFCPHCHKSGKKSGMTVWHFDKCRHKPSIDSTRQ